MTDKTPGACQCHEKHAPTYWKSVVREYKDALEKAGPRPLTPDAITDEMVKRGESYMKSRPWTVSGLLRAALTEPPARPEGAEDIEVLLFDAVVDENRAEVANFLAARLTVSPKEDR